MLGVRKEAVIGNDKKMPFVMVEHAYFAGAGAVKDNQPGGCSGQISVGEGELKQKHQYQREDEVAVAMRVKKTGNKIDKQKEQYQLKQ